MKRKRKYIKLREQLAAALSMLLPQVQRDELRSKKAPAKTVIALFSPDHSVLHALGGSDRWWNLTPMLRELALAVGTYLSGARDDAERFAWID